VMGQGRVEEVEVRLVHERRRVLEEARAQRKSAEAVEEKEKINVKIQETEVRRLKADAEKAAALEQDRRDALAKETLQINERLRSATRPPSA